MNEVARQLALAAGQEHAHAQFNLGMIYDHGYGVSQGHVRAVEWHGKSSNQRHAGTQYNLGVM